MNEIVTFELQGNVVSSEMLSIIGQADAARRVRTQFGFPRTPRLMRATLLAEARRSEDAAGRRATVSSVEDNQERVLRRRWGATFTPQRVSPVKRLTG